jgi:hypothetical protein
MPVSGYGADSGVRLEAVWLTHDPEYPDNLPAGPLVRYEYTPRGELAAVYDRGGTQVRSFTYDDKHPGRMTAHSTPDARRPPTATMMPGGWWRSITLKGSATPTDMKKTPSS